MEFMAILILIGVIGIMGIRFYNVNIRPFREASAIADTADLITFDESSRTATLISRSSKIADVIKIRDACNYSIKNEPEKIHVGAVTVGGVTTGGAYTTGGYNYVAGTSKSGYCNLEYAGHMVTHIKLSKSQFYQAKTSAIAPYLNRETEEIDVHTPVHYSEAEARMILNNVKTTGFAGNDHRGYPTREKCEQILDWLCGSDT